MRRLLVLLLALAMSACAAAVPPVPDCPPDAPAPALVLRGTGLHTELNLDAAALTRRAAILPRGAPAVRLGFGKRGFFDHPSGPGLQAYSLAPFPGEAVLEALPLAALPRGEDTIALPLPDPDGLSRFVDHSLPPGPVPEGRFIPAARRYSLLYTCNTWVAEALEHAGLPVSPAGVSRASGVLRQAARVPAACRVR